MAGQITERFIGSVLQQPMSVRGTFRWRQKSNDAWTEATLKVSHPDSTVSLEIIMTASLEQDKFGICLLLNGTAIRRYDRRHGHINKHTDNWATYQAHEHVFTDLCHGHWARDASQYPTDIEGAFGHFCTLLNITAEVQFQPLPDRQLGMEEF